MNYVLNTVYKSVKWGARALAALTLAGVMFCAVSSKEVYRYEGVFRYIDGEIRYEFSLREYHFPFSLCCRGSRV